MPKTQEITFQLPYLYPKQHAFAFDSAPITVCFASTKSGKSFGLLVWLLAQSLTKGGDNRGFYWIAPSYHQAKLMHRRMKQFLRSADPNQTIWQSNESDLIITLTKIGSILYFKTGDNPDLIYGDDAYAVVIDEGSRQREEILELAQSLTTKTDGAIKVIGNMLGRNNWMYRLWLQGLDGSNPDISSHILTCWDAIEAGQLKREVIESKRRNMDPAEFRALYECEPLNDDASNPFGSEYIDQCIANLSTKPAASFAIDLARNVDYTVVMGVDEDGYVCRFERWQGFDYSTQIDLILNIIGATPTLIDATGVGLAVLDNLKARAWERGIHSDIEGFTFTSSSKAPLIGNLITAIRTGRIHYPDGIIPQELRNFEAIYKDNGNITYSAPSGLHDDCVMALALCAKQANCPHVVPQIIHL